MSHRFAMRDGFEAYDVFAAASHTAALKVGLHGMKKNRATSDLVVGDTAK